MGISEKLTLKQK